MDYDIQQLFADAQAAYADVSTKQAARDSTAAAAAAADQAYRDAVLALDDLRSKVNVALGGQERSNVTMSR
jgi:hypothetical protein